MGQVENSLLAVVELSDGQHDAHEDERDVAGARQQRATWLEGSADFTEAPLGSRQVLDHIECDDGVGRPAHRFQRLRSEVLVEILLEVWVRKLPVRSSQVERNDPGTLFVELESDLPMTGS